jgi:VWFA-related protein
VFPQQEQRAVTQDGREVTVLVTVHPHDDRTRAIADKLQPGDFAVRENNERQQITSVRRAAEAPTILAVLIQDDLVPRVNNEIRGIKDVIRGLPDGSRVLTGYLTVGSLSVSQDFTTDRDRAAKSLRIIRSSTSASPYNPYVGLIEALRRFDSQPAGRRAVLLISDGLDTSHGFRSASPALSIDLGRAIEESQRRGVSVFTIYAPSVGLTRVNHLAINFGQGSLSRLSDETGGEALFSGTDFVSFDSYLREFSDLRGRQWLITYRSTSTGSGFRRIQVTTEYDVPLYHPAGYRLRDKDLP